MSNQLRKRAFYQILRKHSSPDIHLTPTYRRTSHVVKSYAILMTPRSGSTWLTHCISARTLLGCPDEYFNINTFEASLLANPSMNIFDYYDNVSLKVTSPAGVFGFEITYFDLELLEQEAYLTALMTGEKYFFRLRRHNFVAQAVSMYFAEKTGVFHIFDGQFSSRHAHAVEFDGERIKHWACHILQQEYGLNRWLEKLGIEVCDFYYEDLVQDMNAVVHQIAERIGCLLVEEFIVDSKINHRLAGVRNAAFETLFRERYAEWCIYWSNARGAIWCDE